MARHIATNSTRQTGFTLLEVLIAISITALVGLGSWQLLNSAIRTYELSQKSLQSLGSLQRAQLNISRDFRQIVPRAIRDEFGDYQAAVTSKLDFYSVEFSRVGWRNPLQEPRSDLQRVAYELNDGDLLRHHWKVMDRAQDSEPVTRRLLRDVESFELSYLNDSNAWVDEWPPESQGSGEESQDALARYATLPKAIRVELVHPSYGQIIRVFEQGMYIENTLMQTNNGSNGGSSGENQDNQNTGGDSGNNGNAGGANNQSGNQTSGGGFNAGGSVGTGDSALGGNL